MKLKAFIFNGDVYIRCVPSKKLFHSTMVHEVVNRGDIFALRCKDQQLTIIPGKSEVEHIELSPPELLPTQPPSTLELLRDELLEAVKAREERMLQAVDVALKSHGVLPADSPAVLRPGDLVHVDGVFGQCRLNKYIRGTDKCELWCPSKQKYITVPVAKVHRIVGLFYNGEMHRG